MTPLTLTLDPAPAAPCTRYMSHLSNKLWRVFFSYGHDPNFLRPWAITCVASRRQHTYFTSFLHLLVPHGVLDHAISFFFFWEKQCIRQLRIVTKYLAILPNALEQTSEARDRGKNALMHTHCGVVWDSSNLGGFPHLPPTH